MVLLDLFQTYGPWAWFVTGLILLGAVVYGIVQWTNAKYAHEKPAAAATK